jgi:hypothetical protein
MTQVEKDAPTWDALIADARSGAGSDARHDVGAWAMQRVREALGEDWPQRWHARCGCLPAFISDPATDALAYAELIETGLRLDRLSGTLRLTRLTRQWSRQLELIQLRHSRLQLEVAALARSRGAAAEFETEFPEVSRPADVVITEGHGPLIAECFCVYNDVPTREALAYDRDLGLRLQMIALDLRLAGHWDVRLPAAETAELLAEVERVAAQVSADGHDRTVTRAGIELRLSPWASPESPEATLEGPTTRAQGWPRARGIISAKAQDWKGASVPVWLRFDLLDGTWLFSDWAQRSLPEKTEWMAALVAEAAGDAGTAGVVVSCGPLIDTRAMAGDYIGTGGIAGLRRRLDALRARETIVVPLSPAGASHARLWRDLYDAEPQWLAEALKSASLPGVDAIESGWSVPVQADPRQPL